MLPNSPILSSLRCCSLHHCEAMHLRSSLEVLLKGLSQRCLGHSADDSVHLGAVLEDHHSWDAADAVLCCYSRALVCVELELQQEGSVSLASYVSHWDDRCAELALHICANTNWCSLCQCWTWASMSACHRRHRCSNNSKTTYLRKMPTAGVFVQSMLHCEVRAYCFDLVPVLHC